MQIKTLARALICTMALAWAGIAHAVIIDIYIGNNASFASSATNPGSFQGFTFIRDRWTNSGATVSITSAFAPVGKDIFLATAPQSAWNASQVTDLQTFLNAGGWFILSHDGFGGVPNMNNLLANLGSGMLFGPTPQAGGTQTLTITDPTDPLMQNMPSGPTLTGFSIGSVAGGTALAGFNLPVISFESIGAGGILAVADFDLLNNVTDLFFAASARPNNHQFWDNILFAHQVQVPEPGTLALLGIGLLGMGAARRRRKV